jgi:glutamate-ammonia-ligase adenylyltransferase
MTIPDLQLSTVKALCRDVNDDLIRDFLSRMDQEYVQQFQPAQIAAHITLTARLDTEHLSQVSFEPAADGSVDVSVVAYDYFSEFAVICGLLSSFGLDILEGRIYTFSEPVVSPPPRGSGASRSRAVRRTGSSRKNIVDLFRVRPISGAVFGLDQQQLFARELEEMVRLLDAQRFQEARNHVNRRLVETLGRTRGRFTGLLHPLRIDFDNDQSATDTVIDLRSVDTPAFLYAFANGLAMRGLYIRKARFERVGMELHDRFFVQGRHGGKIVHADDQQELRLTATLIKQFTHFLTWAPDPAKALDHFDRFLDQLLEGGRSGRALDFLKEKKTLVTLAKLLGTSDFLWEDFLRRQHANLLPMLDTYQQVRLVRPKSDMVRELRKRLASNRSDEQRRRTLNQYKDQELFRIDMKHLMDPQTSLVDFSRALTDLAEVVLEQALRECQTRLAHAHGVPQRSDGKPCPSAIFGMGKFGGSELGFASDIEVLFVYGGSGRTNGREPLDNSEYFERLMQGLLQWIEAKQEGIFHIDVRLRPHGSQGSLANSFDEVQRYYSDRGQSAPFERQALIKLRYVGGDEDLGRHVEAHRDRYVYGAAPWPLDESVDLRRRQIKELTDPGQTNIKYSPGGLIDVEYGIQYLQLLHGRRHRAVRTPNTLLAIGALQDAKVLTAAESKELRAAYLFCRNLIDGLRIVRGHAKDLVLPARDSEAFVFLARRVGYTTETWEEGAGKLARDVERHMAAAREFFTRRFGTL